MAQAIPFAEANYTLTSCLLREINGVEEARVLAELIVNMDPWRTLGYSVGTMENYLLRADAALYRYAVITQDKICGVMCVRYPWLRGSYLELIGLDASTQGHGVGTDLMRWLEEQTRLSSRNVWILVSSFNTKARAFYQQHGYTEVGLITDFVAAGYDELLLRKVVHSSSLQEQ